MSKKLIIETVAGNTIIDADSYVGSDLNGNLFAKRASDINVGEKLYFEKEAIHKTLEDIETDLMESPRYRTARNSLFVQKDGKEQTALSYHLNNSPMLKNLKEEEKISKLHEAIGGKVTRQTVKNWISGETVMPELENLGLLVNISPELKDYYEGFQQKKGGLAYPLYDLYVNIRQGIMRYVAEAKGKGNGEKKEQIKPLQNISLDHEIKIVVDKYFNEISDQLISARVTGIKEIERNGALKLAGENQERLRKGVVRINPARKIEFLEKNKINETKLIDMENDKGVLENILARYFDRLLKGRYNIDLPHRYVAHSISQNRLQKLVDVRNKTLFGMHPLIPEKKEAKQKEMAEIFDKFRNDNKRLENINHLLEQTANVDEHNTIEIIANNINAICNSIPPTYIKYIETNKELWEKLSRVVTQNKDAYMKLKQWHDRKIIDSKKLQKELKDSYGLDTSITRKYESYYCIEEDDISTIEEEKAVLKKYKMEDLIPKVFG